MQYYEIIEVTKVTPFAAKNRGIERNQDAAQYKINKLKAEGKENVFMAFNPTLDLYNQEQLECIYKKFIS